MRLTTDQINKLSDRDNLDPKVRRDNEFALRGKLKDFLEFMGDANYIFDHLPREQLQKNDKLAELLTDYTLQESLELVINIMDLLDYGVISGPVDKPYLVVSHDGEPSIVRPANSIDFDRHLMIKDFVCRLSDYYNQDIEKYRTTGKRK